VLAVPFAGTVKVPLVGVTETPEAGVAVQFTVCALPLMDCTDSVAVVVEPGCMIGEAGVTEPVAPKVGPYEGGASAAAVPHVVGVVLSEKSSVAPFVSEE
jgi:hypothetical protein